MTNHLRKLPMEALKIQRLQWYGHAFLHQRDLSALDDPTTPEAHRLAGDFYHAIGAAEACEAEIERRRSKSKGRAAAEAVLESTEPTEPPPPNLVIGPWAAKLRR